VLATLPAVTAYVKFPHEPRGKMNVPLGTPAPVRMAPGARLPTRPVTVRLPAERIVESGIARGTLTTYVPVPPVPVVPLTPRGPKTAVPGTTPAPVITMPTVITPPVTAPVTFSKPSKPSLLMRPLKDSAPAEIAPVKVAAGVPAGQYADTEPTPAHARSVALGEPGPQEKPAAHGEHTVEEGPEKEPGRQLVHAPSEPEDSPAGNWPAGQVACADHSRADPLNCPTLHAPTAPVQLLNPKAAHTCR